MSSVPTPNFFILSHELRLLFEKQIARLEVELKPHGPHSLGNRKPDLEEQEYSLSILPDDDNGD